MTEIDLFGVEETTSIAGDKTDHFADTFQIKIDSPENEGRRSIDELIKEIKQQLDQLTPVAIKNMNPFATVKELEEFSASIGQGAHHYFYFQEQGFGEHIQGWFVLSFFRKFFPKIELESSFQHSARPFRRKMIDVSMNDLYEYGSKMGTDVEFSMTQAKILHSHQADPELVAELRAAILDEIKKSYHEDNTTMPLPDVPIIVSDLRLNSLPEIQDSFRIIAPEVDRILCGLYDASTGMYHPEADIPITDDKILRVLYTIGDYSLIHHRKNKMEGAVAGNPIIVVNPDFSKLSENPNAVLDNILTEYGYIVTLDDVKQKGLAGIAKPPVLTDQLVSEIYERYLSSPDRTLYDQDFALTVESLLKKMCSRWRWLAFKHRKLFS